MTVRDSLFRKNLVSSRVPSSTGSEGRRSLRGDVYGSLLRVETVEGRGVWGVEVLRAEEIRVAPVRGSDARCGWRVDREVGVVASTVRLPTVCAEDGLCGALWRHPTVRTEGRECVEPVAGPCACPSGRPGECVHTRDGPVRA